MTHPGITVHRDRDGRSIRLRVQDPDKADSHIIKLSTAQTDDLIEQLGIHRMKMDPAIPQVMERRVLDRSIAQPAWIGHILPAERSPSAEPPESGIIISLRHPSYGWMPFFFGIEGAVAIGSFMIRSADKASRPDSAPKIN